MEEVNLSRLEENQTSLGRLLVTNIVDRVSYINDELIQLTKDRSHNQTPVFAIVFKQKIIKK